MKEKTKFKLECNKLSGVVELAVKSHILSLDINKSFICPDDDGLQFNEMLENIKDGDVLLIKRVKVKRNERKNNKTKKI
jgi:hypothetical protein